MKMDKNEFYYILEAALLAFDNVAPKTMESYGISHKEARLGIILKDIVITLKKQEKLAISPKISQKDVLKDESKEKEELFAALASFGD